MGFLDSLTGSNNIFALGDLCIMETPKYPNGHPQVAQAAIQQAKLLGSNLIKLNSRVKPKEFEYKNKGSMATIWRNLAVADLPATRLTGFVAWALWPVVHLFMIVGVKNRLSIFMNWSWNYFTYDQSLRLLIRPKAPLIYDQNAAKCSPDNKNVDFKKAG